MITRRDQEVISFLQSFKAAKTSTVCQLFYGSYRVCARRLCKMTQESTIKRERDGWSAEYVYFIKRPKQMRHALLLTDFYRELHKIADIKRFIPEPTLGSVRPDAAVGFIHNGKSRLALVEVEVSNKGFDRKKYDAFDWAKYFPVEPEVIVISDRKAETRFKTTVLNTSLTNIAI
jgi:hypothetical protein